MQMEGSHLWGPASLRAYPDFPLLVGLNIPFRVAFQSHVPLAGSPWAR